MSTTHFVNALNDLSIFSRPVPANPSITEWVLKLTVIDPVTNKAQVIYETITGSFMSLAVRENATSGYDVTVDHLPMETAGAKSAHEITSDSVSYDFVSDVYNAPSIYIEDLSMQLTAAFEGSTINDHVVILHIEATTDPGTYRHRVWHHDGTI